MKLWYLGYTQSEYIAHLLNLTELGNKEKLKLGKDSITDLLLLMLCGFGIT